MNEIDKKHKQCYSQLKAGFCLPADQGLTTEQQTHLKNYFIEFFAQLRKTDTKCNDVGSFEFKPNTTSSYVSGI